MVEYHALVAYGHVTWLRGRSNHWRLLWRRRVSQTGSPMLVVHSTHAQLPGRKSICRRLSGNTALDTSGRDLIFCFVTTELGQDSWRNRSWMMPPTDNRRFPILLEISSTNWSVCGALLPTEHEVNNVTFCAVGTVRCLPIVVCQSLDACQLNLWCLSTFGRRAFAVAGPTMFNALPDELRDPAVSITTFGQLMKTPFLCLSARLTH